MNGSALCVQLGALPSPFQEVDCKFNPEPGSFICIRPAHGVQLTRVLVAIHAEFEGLLERALATRNPATGTWEYMRRTNHPARNGATVEISIVPAGGQPASALALRKQGESLAIQVRCGAEIHRMVFWQPKHDWAGPLARSVVISMGGHPGSSASAAMACAGLNA